MRTVRRAIVRNMYLTLTRRRGRWLGILAHEGKEIVPIVGDDADDVWRRLYDATATVDPHWWGWEDARSRYLGGRPLDPRDRTSHFPKIEQPGLWAAEKRRLDAAVPLAAARAGGGHGTAMLGVLQPSALRPPFLVERLNAVLRSPQADDWIGGAARFADGDVAGGLAQMQRGLAPHRAAWWDVVTWLPFLWRPKRHMALLDGWVGFAAHVRHRFAWAYRPALEPPVYAALLDLAAEARAEIAVLRPRDGLDVLQFMDGLHFHLPEGWPLAPPGLRYGDVEPPPPSWPAAFPADFGRSGGLRQAATTAENDRRLQPAHEVPPPGPRTRRPAEAPP